MDNVYVTQVIQVHVVLLTLTIVYRSPVCKYSFKYNYHNYYLYSNGDCVDGVNEYRCNCDAGFAGDNCDININDCAVNACGNNGQCVDLLNGFDCICPVGFSGELCNDEDDVCDNRNPCLNGGICMNTQQGAVGNVGRFRCECLPPFFGEICERTGSLELEIDTSFDEDVCLSDPCLNNGVCVNQNEVLEYSCRCPFGTRGKRCEEIFACQIPFTTDLI